MSTGSGQVHRIEMNKLNLSQLSQLKQQIDQEIEFFANSLQQLKIAQSKFQESADCLEKITPDNSGKQILVPLTGSMYVPGQLNDTEHVLVDIGTGYYIEKEVPAARDYFKRKIKYVSDQVDKVQELTQEKVRVRDALMELLEMRVQAQINAQQAAGGVK